MKQFAVIGVDKLGIRLIEELSQIDCEIMIVDKDPELIEKLKDKVTSAYIADAINEETINRLVPPSIDAAILDLGNSIEVSILVCNYLKKMGVREIIVKAETDEHGEILTLVGATRVIFPNRETAKRLAPALLSSQLFDYLPISSGLVIAEITMPDKYIGMTLVEADLRRKHNLNVVALRRSGEEEYVFFDPDHRIQSSDFLLVAGNDVSIAKFTGGKVASGNKSNFSRKFMDLFSRK